jgi:hypothetical protein
LIRAAECAGLCLLFTLGALCKKYYSFDTSTLSI